MSSPGGPPTAAHSVLLAGSPPEPAPLPPQVFPVGQGACRAGVVGARAPVCLIRLCLFCHLSKNQLLPLVIPVYIYFLLPSFLFLFLLLVGAWAAGMWISLLQTLRLNVF